LDTIKENETDIAARTKHRKYKQELEVAVLSGAFAVKYAAVLGINEASQKPSKD
jgi:hypothetical protein